MEVLVAYDVATDTPDGQRRLRRVAQACLNFGQRVQKSLFECSVNEMQLEEMKNQLLDCIDEKEDNLRIYRLPEPKDRYVEHHGTGEQVDFHGPLIV
jgi:CRISPR-associated protein Cas2